MKLLQKFDTTLLFETQSSLQEYCSSRRSSLVAGVPSQTLLHGWAYDTVVHSLFQWLKVVAKYRQTLLSVSNLTKSHPKAAKLRKFAYDCMDPALRGSGVTKVGVTWCGNRWCHPVLPQKLITVFSHRPTDWFIHLFYCFWLNSVHTLLNRTRFETEQEWMNEWMNENEWKHLLPQNIPHRYKQKHIKISKFWKIRTGD